MLMLIKEHMECNAHQPPNEGSRCKADEAMEIRCFYRSALHPPSLSPFVKANAYADIKIKLKALIYVCITVYV